MNSVTRISTRNINAKRQIYMAAVLREITIIIFFLYLKSRVSECGLPILHREKFKILGKRKSLKLYLPDIDCVENIVRVLASRTEVIWSTHTMYPSPRSPLIPINHRYERLRLISTCLRARYTHFVYRACITGHVHDLRVHEAELMRHTVNRKQDVDREAYRRVTYTQICKSRHVSLFCRDAVTLRKEREKEGRKERKRTEDWISHIHILRNLQQHNRLQAFSNIYHLIAI